MSDQNTPYLKNTWYVAALSTELDKDLLSRVLLDTKIVFYRKEDGTPVALLDRCPHRFAPLSMGKQCGNDVVCPYHGLAFNSEGNCTSNPHGNKRIPTKAKVPSFPLMEKHGFIWIWMGDEVADENQLPDYTTLDTGHNNAIAYTYMKWPCHYELIIDNVMDLSHVDHLHGEIITTRGQLSPQIPKLEENAGQLAASWEWKQTPPMLIFNDFLPEPGKEASHRVTVTWAKPANIQLSIGCSQGNQPITFESEESVSQYDLHVCTPESENSTHYFFVTRRNHHVEDAEYNQIKIQNMHAAFELEDGPILNAVEEAMETPDFLSLDPVLISSDAAPVRVRRTLKALIEEEHKTKLTLAS